MTNLESLPDDVKRLIAGELYECHSIRLLWQVSKAWHAVAESFVYRGLAWDVTSEHLSVLDDAERLLSRDNHLCKFLEHAR